MRIPQLHDWPATAAGAVDLVAGCDAAYHPTDPVVFAAVVVLQVAYGAVVETRTATREANFPYIPGLLSHRELPALLAAFAELRQAPDAAMLD